MAKKTQDKTSGSKTTKNPARRRWCFTLFNRGEIIGIEAHKDIIRYYVWQNEICPDTNRKHIQGYLILNSSKGKRLGGMKKILPTAHWEPAIYSHKICRAYCTKEESRDPDDLGPEEWGEPLRQGARTDLEMIQKMIKEGAKETEISDQFFTQWSMYGRRFQAFRQLHQPPCVWEKKIIWLWGPAGTGKSRWAYETYPDADRLNWDGTHMHGYHNNDVVVLDDYRGEIDVSNFLRLTDRYPYDVRVMYGSMVWNPKIIIITSNYSPEELFHGRERSAALRRITEVRHLTEVFV